MSDFLFSVDLEEFYAADTSREFRRTPLPVLTEVYLDFLRRQKMKATFFVVGEVAEKFASTIQAIASEGHELGCHTHTHVTLDRHDAASLREDLRRNLDAVQRCVSAPVKGFRAPVLSLTERTQWAYDVLAGLGFEYSSSVLPAKNPLHGWPGFGAAPRRINGVVELPITLARFGPLQVPVGAGTYFRCLPFRAIRQRFAELGARQQAVVGYFHPYDVDTDQEWVMHNGVTGNPLLNALLYVNRSKTIRRLEAVVASGFRIARMDEYLLRWQEADGSRNTSAT